MPQMDGLTFLQDAAPAGGAGVVRCRPWSSAPRRRRRTCAAARAAGANFYLVKPVSQETLVEHVVHHVRAAGMNEFVEQFLIEGRELVEQGNDDLLALEEHPDDRERLDGAFRAFHTLKGAAGIVDFVAMGRALHAARGCSFRRPVGRRAGDAASDRSCLACLDQVGAWIDQMQASGRHSGRLPMPRPTISSVAFRRLGAPDASRCRRATRAAAAQPAAGLSTIGRAASRGAEAASRRAGGGGRRGPPGIGRPGRGERAAPSRPVAGRDRPRKPAAEQPARR